MILAVTPVQLWAMVSKDSRPLSCQAFKGVDKSTDQTAIIGEKIGDLIGDKHLSPIIANYRRLKFHI